MFLTVYPGAYGSNERRQQSFRAPHINLRVTHDNFRTYNTVLYFANDTRNMEDRRFNSLSAIAQSAITMQVASRDPHDWNNGAQAAVDIVIPGKDPFRRY